MSWKFDPFIVDIVRIPTTKTLTELADISMGDAIESDLKIEMGDRTNDSSNIDQGLRVFDGDF